MLRTLNSFFRLRKTHTHRHTHTYTYIVFNSLKGEMNNNNFMNNNQKNMMKNSKKKNTYLLCFGRFYMSSPRKKTSITTNYIHKTILLVGIILLWMHIVLKFIFLNRFSFLYLPFLEWEQIKETSTVLHIHTHTQTDINIYRHTHTHT